MMNKVILIGRLGQDVELKSTQGGTSVAQLSLATDDSYKDKAGELKKVTDWHKVVVWGPQAESCSKFLSKGSQVCVEGKSKTRSYEDKQGVKKYVTEIRADRVQFLDPPKGEGRKQGNDEPFAPADDDEIPF